MPTIINVHEAKTHLSKLGWEIATKYRLGKLSHAREAAISLPALLHKARMKTLPMTMEHALATRALPGPHRDPFDRLPLPKVKSKIFQLSPLIQLLLNAR